MQRFYFNIGLDTKLLIEDKDFFKQISFVLRSRLGDEVILFNGDSFDYLYKITSISKKGIELEFVEKVENDSDPKLEITLYQAIPNKYEKIDYILQKGVEVGIGEFVFFVGERSSKLVINENKIKRFQNIIKESLEQCLGNKKPELLILDKLDLGEIKGRTLVCHTKIIRNKKISEENIDEKLNIFVGPEGGFSDKEVDDFEKYSFEFVNFGSRILRTETISSVLAFKILNGN